MFEKDNRKQQRERRHQEIPLSPGRAKSPEEANTVYGELKLSEKLSLEMIQLRKEKDTMLERIEKLQV